jgi:hypothetical protein
VVDLQQLPDERVWMVVGTLPTTLPQKPGTEAWLSDLYSAMVRRMAARLVQFGFLDAPNRARLRVASPMAITQALKPPSPVTLPAQSPQPPSTPAATWPAQPAEPTGAVAQASRPDVEQSPTRIEGVQGTASAPSPNL